jgi:hypothetical protein
MRGRETMSVTISATAPAASANPNCVLAGVEAGAALAVAPPETRAYTPAPSMRTTMMESARHIQRSSARCGEAMPGVEQRSALRADGQPT